MEVQEAAAQDDVVYVDVREQHEWDTGHIDGAIHVPMGEITSRVDEFDPDRRYVAVCKSGVRSARVAGFLQGQGIDIENLEGGMHAWDDAGLPMVSEYGEPPRVF